MTVDVEDSTESHSFFVALKGHLLERFRQIEVYLISYPIDVL